MPQQKSTKFLAAKVANFGVVMGEMVGKIGQMEKEIKRLRHHVSVLSKRNNELVKNGKSRAASPIASDASFSSNDVELESELGEEGLLPRQKVVRTLVGEEAREKAHGDGVLALWCGEVAEEFLSECQARDKYLGRTKWKVAELEVAEEVEVVSVAEEEEEMAEPKVRLPKYEDKKGKRRSVGEVTEEEEEVREVRELIAPLGPRAIFGGLLRRVGKESMFKNANPRLVAGSSSTPAAVGVSQRSDAWRQSPGASGGYQLRPRVGGFGYRGRGGMFRGRGV